MISVEVTHCIGGQCRFLIPNIRGQSRIDLTFVVIVEVTPNIDGQHNQEINPPLVSLQGIPSNLWRKVPHKPA